MDGVYGSDLEPEIQSSTHYNTLGNRTEINSWNTSTEVTFNYLHASLGVVWWVWFEVNEFHRVEGDGFKFSYNLTSSEVPWRFKTKEVGEGLTYANVLLHIQLLTTYKYK